MMGETARDRMLAACRAWLFNLDSYPGWKEWRRERIGHTLHFDDPFSQSDNELDAEFHFCGEVKKQHAVILQYLMLQETINLTKECEYYFRRYPFRDLPVTRASHITNICEMFFGRFYEFKERLKKYFDALEAVEPRHKLDVGNFINLFNKEFEQELKARNISIHHEL